MQKKKSGIMKSGLDAMPLFLLDDLLSAWKFLFDSSWPIKNIAKDIAIPCIRKSIEKVVTLDFWKEVLLLTDPI